MSDDKIVRITEIVPAADDFGERVVSAVEESVVINSKGESIGTVGESSARCSKRYDGMPCTLLSGHKDNHRGLNGALWADGMSDLVEPVDLRKKAKLMNFAELGAATPQGAFLSADDLRRFAESRGPFPDYTKKQPLTPKRPWTVNIGSSVPIPPGVGVTCSEQMQILFKAKQMVGSANGGRLYVTGAYVGNRVQLMQWSGKGMLMDFLKERTDVDFDTAQPGINISVTVMNRGTEPGSFDLTLFGEAAL